MRGNKGALFFYSSSDRQSFEALGSWIGQIKLHGPTRLNFTIIGVDDDRAPSVVSHEELVQFAKDQDIKFFYINLTTSSEYEISKPFLYLARRTLGLDASDPLGWCEHSHNAFSAPFKNFVLLLLLNCRFRPWRPIEALTNKDSRSTALLHKDTQSIITPIHFDLWRLVLEYLDNTTWSGPCYCDSTAVVAADFQDQLQSKSNPQTTNSRWMQGQVCDVDTHRIANAASVTISTESPSQSYCALS